jgi:hypothetical protein
MIDEASPELALLRRVGISLALSLPAYPLASIDQ